MGKFGRTRAILASCFDLLMTEKQLIFFPVLSLSCTGLLLASFVLPLHGAGHSRVGTRFGGYSSTEILELFVFYCGSYFATAFFNAGLTVCVIRYMRGERPTFGDGIASAFSLIHRIAGWALIAATVGTALRIVESDSRTPIGRILASIFGVTFSVATYFVIPVLVAGGQGPIGAVKESVQLFKKTWGEQFITALGFGTFYLLLVLPAILLIIFSIFTGGIADPAARPIIFLAVVWAVVCMLVMSALEAIFRTSLYAYATTGKAPEGFNAEALQAAFRPRKKILGF